MEKTKNVFISHFHDDDEHVHKLKDLLAEKGYQLKNSSIDSTKPNQATNPEYIRRLLRLRIQWSGTTIVLIGHHTHTREWVDWEIEQAHKKGKRIVGVYINGASDADVPENFKLYGDALVGWTGEKIIGAIEGTINNWENPDGTSWETPWVRVTSDC
jgi:ribonuclease BN (tRNA processing enzyme)